MIDGGLAIFASGNEYAGMAAFPAAYSKCISVSAVAADFTPASYSNYGKEVTISAPGGDTEYYNPVGQDDPEGWEEGIHSGSILSTWIQNGNATYGLWMVHLWLVRMYQELQHWGCRMLSNNVVILKQVSLSNY